MTEEEYLARLGLLRPQSGKRKPQEPVPPGSSVLDVPAGGTRRIPDTVLRRPAEAQDTITGLPEPSMAQRHAEGLAGYLTPKIGGPKARAIAQTALGGDESALPFGIGLQELVPFSPYVAEDAGRMVRSGVEAGSPLEIGLGLGLGALQASPAALPLARGAKAVGKRVREAADPEAIRQYVRQTQGLSGMPGTAVIKPKGGNWLAGAVEQSLTPLRPRAVTGGYRSPGEELQALRETFPPEGLQRLRGSRPGEAEYIEQQMKDLETRTALDNWVQNKIGKYIKNEMGTADDPIRKQVDEWAQAKPELLAQKDEQIDRLQKKMVEARQARGLTPDQEAMLTRSRAELEELRRQRKYIEDQKGLHFDPYNVTNGEELTLDTIPGVVSQRTAYGFPREGLGKDPTARQWEALSDMAISDVRAGTIQNAPNTAAQLAKAEQNYQQVVDSVNDAVRARIKERSPDISERDLNIFAKDFGVQKSLRTGEEIRLLEDARAELFKAQNADKPKYKTILEENPWVTGVDPETRLFERPITDELGFDHLVDELKNAMRPDSGLPSRLQLRPEDLSKMTVAKAARLVDEINAYRSGVKADADRAVASNAATVEVKSYDVIPGTDVPNTQGFAWKQIKPFQFRSEDQLQGEALEAYRRHLSLGATQEQAFKSVSDIYGRNAVQDALKYEGDILSHCVGGYCDDVLSGRSQIFSLRDANGMPAVTIETRPGRPWNQRSGFFYEHPELEQPWVEFSTAVKKQTKEQNLPRDPNYIIGFPKWLSENQPEMYAKYANLFEETPADIIQIKGKKNGPPAPEHLPFVQDFVRNGNWGSIGDFKNTGFDFPATGPNGIFDADQIKTLEANGVRVPKLLTRDEAKSLQDQLYRIETGKNPETGMAQGGLVSDPNKAAFGIYPSSGKRPERLNQSRDVNVPLQLARGWTAGLLGLPGDIEGLVRMLPGIKEETPVLPTSDFYREYLPGYDPKPFARAVSGLGALSGGVGATRVAGRVAEAAKPGNVRQYVRQTQGLTGLPGTAVIKPKGGNWLEGSIEKSTSKWTEDLEPMNLGDITERNGVIRAQEMLRQYQESPRYRQQNAINKWVDKKLNKYIRNEMATPEDPVRKLIEDTGASHIPFEETWQPESLVARRKAVGFPEEGLAAQKYNQSAGSATPQTLENLTRAGEWESRTDQVIENLPAKEWLNLHGYHKVSNPWLTEIDPKTMVYRPSRVQMEDDLGFDHLIDELRNAIAPNSDLPAHLRWKPEDLDKVTMAQAVERVSKINDWRAAQMEAARKAAREGIPVHKQYEGGYQWMAAPDTAVDPKSLRYIQDVGCESGWCTQSESLARQYGGGGNQLYVLHDPNGKSVVQISVKPGKPWNERSGVFYDNPELEDSWRQFAIEASAAEKGNRPSNYILRYPEWLSNNHPELYQKYEQVFKPNPPEIVEIKGRQNRAPKDEYLPMVQDFVRSGKWSRVGDIQNTGMRPTSSVFNENELQRLREAGAGDIPQALTGEDIQRLHNLITPEGKRLKYDAKGNIVGSEDAQNYAAGGLVQNTDTLRDKLIAAGMDPDQAMTQGLRMADQMEMAKGGLASVLKGAAPKTKGTYNALPLELPRAPAMSLQEMEKTAERVARQQLGEHIRKPGKTSNLADRSLKESKRLKNLSYVLESTKTPPLEKVVPEKKGQVRVALPGDISVADKVLMEVEGLPIGALQQGGPKYGAGKMDLPNPRFWASNEGPASILQRKVDDLAMVYETPEILAEHMAMGPVGMNFGQHLANANLMAINSSTPHPKAVEQFNEVIRRGFVDPQTKVRVEFPEFPGVENYKASYQAMKENPELRKWFNNRMKTEDVTAPLNFPRGKDIEYAVMEPELRDLEIGMTGLSVGKMQPGASLIKQSAHKTYSHDIPGLYLGRTQELLPVELAFPDASAFIKSTKRPADFTGTMQKVFPHQVVDEQYINELGQYYNRLRQIRGYKDGGAVAATNADGTSNKLI